MRTERLEAAIANVRGFVNGRNAASMASIAEVLAAVEQPAASYDALRDHFAGLAMARQIRYQSARQGDPVLYPNAPSETATLAYDYADAMMAERARRYGGGK